MDVFIFNKLIRKCINDYVYTIVTSQSEILYFIEFCEFYNAISSYIWILFYFCFN